MLSFEEIVEVTRQRQSRDTLLKRQMIDVRDKVNGDWVIPLVDVAGGTALPSPTASFMADAIDHTAMRAASQSPRVYSPPLDRAKMTGKNSVERAEERQDAWYSCWDHSRLDLALPRGFRQLAAYGTSSAKVDYDLGAGRARIRWRDPLTAYPCEQAPEDIDELTDIAWTYGVHPKAMIARWPQTERLVRKSGSYVDSDGLWDFVEWMDRDQIVIGVLGPRFGLDTSSPGHVPSSVWRQSMLLSRAPNRAGMVTAASPMRVTLDRVAGQVASVTGLVELLARMTALDVIATEKSIFPDRYVVGAENKRPAIVGGNWKDGRTGEINLLENVDRIGELTSTVGPNTHPMIDRLERAVRLSSGLVPQFGGETYGALRTGQGIDRMNDIAVDPRIDELHKIMARCLQTLNRGVAAVEKGWFSGRKIFAFSGFGATRGVLEYQPEKLWETGENVVEYPSAGMDAPAAETRVISQVTAGLMSKSTALSRLPGVRDPAAERIQIMLDRTDDAAFTGLVQQAAQGTFPLPDLLRFRELLRQTGDPAKAMEQTQREAQERQAAQAPEPGPGQGAAPETQPGVSMPGMGMEQQGAPPAGPPMPAADRLRMALSAMAARPAGPPAPSQVPGPPQANVSIRG
jgi:hypothetical protein